MTLDDVLKNSAIGLHYGNRILLPFKCDILKAQVEKDIIMDFSHLERGAFYTKKDDCTEVYFHDFKDLFAVVTKYEKIKLVVVEEGSDVFDFETHRKLALDLKENHVLTIEELNDDILFIE